MVRLKRLSFHGDLRPLDLFAEATATHRVNKLRNREGLSAYLLSIGLIDLKQKMPEGNLDTDCMPCGTVRWPCLAGFKWLALGLVGRLVSKGLPLATSTEGKGARQFFVRAAQRWASASL